MEANTNTNSGMNTNQNWSDKINWPVTLFLIIVPLVALISAPIYFYLNGFSWSLLLFTVIFAALTNLSVTAGYHRLFSHKSYDAHPVVKFFFLLIAASGWQGSALKWSSDHRRHHSFIDGDKDPYNIHRGFWFAHMGWMFLKETVDQPIHAPDLEKDVLVKLQDKYYLPIAIFMGFIFPALVGWAMGSFWGGLFIAGVLRITLTQQSTFFVNSLCHTLGKQTYSKEISARDSLFVAFLTHGEGYHNFHHKFQIDYRNGIRWYQWDPTKWTILSLKMLGLAKKLRQIPHTEILKARLQAEEANLRMHGYADEKILAVKNKILSAQEKIKKLKEDYAALKADYAKKREDFKDAYDLKLIEIKREIEVAKLELQVGLKQWQVYLRYA